MAFKINKLESVDFGDFEAVPKLTAGIILRLGQIKWETEEQINGNKNLIASAFGDNEAQVRPMLDQIPYGELMKLWAYLVNGEMAVQSYDKAISELTEKSLAQEEK